MSRGSCLNWSTVPALLVIVKKNALLAHRAPAAPPAHVNYWPEDRRGRSGRKRWARYYVWRALSSSILLGRINFRPWDDFSSANEISTPCVLYFGRTLRWERSSPPQPPPPPRHCLRVNLLGPMSWPYNRRCGADLNWLRTHLFLTRHVWPIFSFVNWNRRGASSGLWFLHGFLEFKKYK